MNDLCRVSIEENEYQNWLSEPEGEEYFDEDAAMEQYYEEKYGDE